MKYYQYQCDSDFYRFLSLSKKHRYKDLYILNGNPLPPDWGPIEVIVEKKKPLGNFLYFDTYIPVVDKVALNILLPLIKNFVEVKEVKHNNPKIGQLYLIHVLNIVDCLDYEKSDIDYYDDGSIMGVWKYKLKKSKVGKYPIFRIKDLLLNDVFISEEVKNAIESSGLKGLNLEEVELSDD